MTQAASGGEDHQAAGGVQLDAVESIGNKIRKFQREMGAAQGKQRGE